MNYPESCEKVEQQFAPARLGVLFCLVVIILLFGGMFSVYCALGFVTPGLFAWGSEFLPTAHGVAGTIALILSCLTVAIAQRIAAGTGGGTGAGGGGGANRWLTITTLCLTFLGGITFLAIQSIEYENALRTGLGWLSPTSQATAATGAAVELGPGDAELGQKRWQATCQSCHGASGGGVVGQGMDIHASQFVQELDDLKLIAFIKTGRTVADPANTTGIQMPPKGGNPMLKDQQLMDIVAYVRGFQDPVSTSSTEEVDDLLNQAPAIDSPKTDDQADTAAIVANAPDQAEPESEPKFWIPHSSLPLAVIGPAGLSPDAFAPALRPDRANLFVGIFFLMNGLYTFQVVVGLAILVWLIYRAVGTGYHKSYGVPIHVARLYWYFTSIIWLLLFPLFYFI